MFTEKEMKAYRHIQAPDELRQKVLKLRKRPTGTIYWLGAVACLLLVLSGVLFRNPGKIIINGQVLEDSVVFYDTASASGRASSSTISVPVELQGMRAAELSVDSGLLTVGDATPAKEVTVSSSQIVWWEIQPDGGDGVFELEIAHKKGVEKVTLYYENAKITVEKGE